MKSKRFIGILLIVAFLLSIPLIAMQFTNEVHWNLFDFVIAGVLLLGTGLAIEVVMKNVKNRKTKIGLVVSILVLLFLVWAELAVGVFGTPFAGS
jgi:cation transport ATPase